MKRFRFNPIALLGILGLFGIVGIITGKKVWLSWFFWFFWFTNYNKPTDERFFRNLAKTGLVCFAAAMLGLAAVIFMRGLNVSGDLIFSFIGGLFAVVLLSFTFLLEFFERRGE